MRTYDATLISDATDQYAKEIRGFHVDEWLEADGNVALANETGDVALFEEVFPGVVTGHYFFHSRGKEAVKVALVMLEEIFNKPYGIEVIRGLTPICNLGARWMNRRLGFQLHGIIETDAGPCQLVMLTKDEWAASNASKESN